MKRAFWVTCGCMCVALGTLGILLPLLPTVPFMLLAAFCFARSSPRLHDWLLNHKTFGSSIRDWNDRGAISRRGKGAATLSIAFVFLLTVLLGAGWVVVAVQAIILTLVLSFIWTRPEE